MSAVVAPPAASGPKGPNQRLSKGAPINTSISRNIFESNAIVPNSVAS